MTKKKKIKKIIKNNKKIKHVQEVALFKKVEKRLLEVAFN